jgi:hypothetical protein
MGQSQTLVANSPPFINSASADVQSEAGWPSICWLEALEKEHASKNRGVVHHSKQSG